MVQAYYGGKTEMNKITTIHELATCDLDLLFENLAQIEWLTSTEVDQRLMNGAITSSRPKAAPWPLKFLAFINPFNIVLLISCRWVSFTTDVQAL